MAKTATATPAATANKPAETAAPAKAKEKSNKPRIVAEVTAISSSVPMPSTSRVSGNKTPYPFAALEVGASFGIKNKGKNALASIVSNQNRNKSNMRQAKNADGTPAFEQIEMKDANGAVVGYTNGAAKMERMKEFFIIDTDPNSDPDGASCRVFRRK
jgi:hypothetical protein